MKQHHLQLPWRDSSWRGDHAPSIATTEETQGHFAICGLGWFCLYIGNESLIRQSVLCPVSEGA